jgi:hypothetical protein
MLLHGFCGELDPPSAFLLMHQLASQPECVLSDARRSLIGHSLLL